MGPFFLTTGSRSAHAVRAAKLLEFPRGTCVSLCILREVFRGQHVFGSDAYTDRSKSGVFRLGTCALTDLRYRKEISAIVYF